MPRRRGARRRASVGEVTGTDEPHGHRSLWPTPIPLERHGRAGSTGRRDEGRLEQARSHPRGQANRGTRMVRASSALPSASALTSRGRARGSAPGNERIGAAARRLPQSRWQPRARRGPPAKGPPVAPPRALNRCAAVSPRAWSRDQAREDRHWGCPWRPVASTQCVDHDLPGGRRRIGRAAGKSRIARTHRRYAGRTYAVGRREASAARSPQIYGVVIQGGWPAPTWVPNAGDAGRSADPRVGADGRREAPLDHIRDDPGLARPNWTGAKAVAGARGRQHAAVSCASTISAECGTRANAQAGQGAAPAPAIGCPRGRAGVATAPRRAQRGTPLNEPQFQDPHHGSTLPNTHELREHQTWASERPKVRPRYGPVYDGWQARWRVNSGHPRGKAFERFSERPDCALVCRCQRNIRPGGRPRACIVQGSAQGFEGLGHEWPRTVPWYVAAGCKGSLSELEQKRDEVVNNELNVRRSEYPRSRPCWSGQKWRHRASKA